MRVLLALTILVLSPTLASAHADPSHAVGFVHGFDHPIGGLDHVLAMLAVGVFAAVVGGRALWLVPLSFVGMMTAGFWLGLSGLDLPFVEVAIALSSLVIGAAAATGRPLPAAGAMALVGVFAIFHGHAHGAEMPAGGSGLSYAAGFVVATALLHLGGIAASLGAAKLLGPHGRGLARVAGAGFAVAGAAMLAGWL